MVFAPTFHSLSAADGHVGHPSCSYVLLQGQCNGQLLLLPDAKADDLLLVPWPKSLLYAFCPCPPTPRRGCSTKSVHLCLWMVVVILFCPKWLWFSCLATETNFLTWRVRVRPLPYIHTVSQSVLSFRWSSANQIYETIWKVFKRCYRLKSHSLFHLCESEPGLARTRT